MPRKPSRQIWRASRTLKNALQKLQRAEANRRQEGEHSQAKGSLPPLLNLPLEIFNIIIEKSGLTYLELIALSLTTKHFRHLAPPPIVITDQSAYLDVEAAGCMSRIYQRFLKPSPLSCTCTNSKLSPFKPTVKSHRCLFCLQPLCTDTSCETTLFLDVATGIFFPASLYPTATAKLMCYPDRLNTFPKFGDFCDTQLTPNLYTPGAAYSTIWCEHHRCPRDLLQKLQFSQELGKSVRKLRTKFFQNNVEPAQKLRFECTWRASNGLVTQEKEVFEKWMKGRFLAGYRDISPNSSVTKSAEKNIEAMDQSQIDELVAAGKLEPVYEKFFYDLVCLHCFRVLPRAGRSLTFANGWNTYTYYANTCVCEQKPFGEGCVGCGATTVKYTSIEAFDYPTNPNTPGRSTSKAAKGPRFYIASEQRVETQLPDDRIYAGGINHHAGTQKKGSTEKKRSSHNDKDGNKEDWRIEGPRLAAYRTIPWKGYTSKGNLPPTDIERKRVVPRNAAKEAQLHNIVRGRSILPLPPRPKIGIQDMPYNVLNRILQYLVEEEDEDLQPIHTMSYDVLEGTYPFLKAWFGSESLETARYLIERK
ncbi:hypothetical protein AA313_de0210411 [Arthrobotrys entomopaga]|nr:hypothetical protein AA313_de0210411 [Arthrobotrys entomopaga]